MKKDKRFEIIYKEGNSLGLCRQILVDNITKVNYLLIKEGYATTITPLLDEKGNVVIGNSKK